MSLKQKHIVVIMFSSIIITGVLLFTLVGYRAYMQWKKGSFAVRYRNSIYRLTAELFRKNITISNVSVKIGDEGMLWGIPILEGSIHNDTKKTITSILIEVSFIEPDGVVLYNDWFYPLGEKYSDGPGVFSRTSGTKNILLPGEGLSFRRAIRNCSEDIVKKLGTMQSFAKGDAEDKIRLIHSISGLSVS